MATPPEGPAARSRSGPVRPGRRLARAAASRRATAALLAALGALALAVGIDLTGPAATADLPDWLLVGGLLGLAATDDATSDIEALVDGVHDLAGGDTDVSFDLDRDDEVGELAGALDDLADELAARERQHAEYRAFTEGVLDAVDDLFFVLDKEDRHRRWNQTLCEVTGYADEELEEMHPLDLFEGDDRDRVGEAIEEGFETGHFEVEADIVTAEGRRIPYEFVASSVEAPDGRPVLAGIGRDVRERRAMERERAESERYRRRLYEITSDPTLSVEAAIDRLLELGRERLGLENAHVNDVDRENGVHQVERAVGSRLVESGAETDLEATYCESTVQTGSVVTVRNTAEGRWAAHPATERWDIGCYVGTQLYADDAFYGTLCFVDEDPREEPFTPAEKTFVDLIARWISQLQQRREQERERAESERYRRSLYEITADQSLDDDEKLDALLELGCERLGLESGVLTRIDGESGRYEVERATASDFVEAGTVTDLENTYCRATIESEDILGVRDTAALSAIDAPAHDAWGISAYVGGKVLVGDELYGTICFVDPEPREAPFTPAEKTFVDLLTRWVSHEFERRRYTEELRQKTRAMEAAPVGVSVADATAEDEPLVYANAAFEELTGYCPEEYLGRNCRFLQGEDTDPEPVAELREAIDAEEQVSVELRNYTKDGEAFWNRVSVAPVEDDEGEVTEYVGFQQDVTERVEAERQLREREQYLQRQKEYVDDVIDSLDDLFYVVGEDRSFERWNRSFVEVTGYDDEAFARMNVVGVIADEDRPAIEAAIDATFEAGSARAEADIETADGERIPYEFEASSLQDPDGDRVIVGVGRDISERRERERQLEALVENTTDPIYIKDRDGVYRFMNRAGASYLGEAPEQVIGSTDEELFDDETAADVATDDERVLEDGERVTREVVRPIEGEEHVFLDQKYPYRDEDGRIVGVMGISRDITERIEQERRLEEREAELSRLMSNVPGMVYRARNEHGWPMEFVSDGATELTGYHPEELESGDVVWGEDVIVGDEDFWDDVQAALEEREPFRLTYPVETADGDRRWLKEQGRGVFDEDGEVEVLEGVMIDVTERVENERELEARSAAMEGAIDGMGILDADGKYEFVNRAHAEMYGYDDVDAHLGEPWAICYSEAETERLEEEVMPTLADGGSWRGEATGQRADGSTFPQDLSLTRLDDGRFICVVRDITERKERERELERTTDLLSRAEEIADLGGWSADVVDGEPRNASWTDNLYDMYGLDPEETPDLETVLEFYHPDDREHHRETFQEALETGASWDHELRLQTVEGEQRWVRNIGEPVVEAGEVVEIRGTVQDVTEQNERERELERTKYLLEQAQRVAEIGGWELDLQTDPPEMTWTDQLYAIHDVTPETAPEDVPGILELYHPEDRDRIQSTIQTAIEEGEPYDMEARVLVEDEPEGHRWIRALGEPVFEDDEVVALRGSIQDVTEQKRYERELERTRDMLQQAQRMGGVGGWEIDVSAPPFDGLWTEGFFDVLEIDERAGFTLDDLFEYVHPDEQDWVRAEVTRGVQSGEPYSLEHRIVTGEGAVRWVRVVAEPVCEDRYRGAMLDVTEQKERELIMEALHETARGLLQTQTPDEVAELAMDTAEEVLDVPCVAVYLLDDESGRLEPVAYTRGFEEACGEPRASTSSEADPLLWQAYVSGSPTGLSGSRTANAGIFRDEIEEAVYVPIGDHGVFVAAASEHTLDHGTRRIAETLVATMEAALHRLDSETDLREREAELAAQNRRLRRQIQVNEIIRTVDQSLMGASSREEIETAVSERLTDGEDVAFAWIGSLDPAGDALVPRAWAGQSHDYLDAVSLTVGRPVADPAVQTATTGDATVVESVVESVKDEEWRKHALVSNFSSAVAVPIALEDYRYGVLAVYGTEPDQFGDLERAVFEELGESIANSINAVETRQALYADAFVELTLQFEDSEDFLARVARETGGTVDYVGLGTHGENQSRVFFEVSGVEAHEVEDVLSGTVAVEGFRPIGTGEEPYLYEATVAGELVASRVVRHGGVPRSMRATAGDLEVTVDVPASLNVREFVETLREHHSSVEMLSRRDVQRDVETRQELVTELFEELTDRQLEVLRTAYFAGFFGWPRESTGEDIADLLGVSQPTVNRHVRHGLQRLLEQLFEEEPATIAQPQ